jgi:hypothetical protein
VNCSCPSFSPAAHCFPLESLSCTNVFSRIRQQCDEFVFPNAGAGRSASHALHDRDVIENLAYLGIIQAVELKSQSLSFGNSSGHLAAPLLIGLTAMSVQAFISGFDDDVREAAGRYTFVRGCAKIYLSPGLFESSMHHCKPVWQVPLAGQDSFAGKPWKYTPHAEAESRQIAMMTYPSVAWETGL